MPFSNQESKNETAIARFASHEQVSTNINPVYATYTSGSFNGFYATEEEAIAHCAKPDSGIEFNGQWIQDKYSAYEAGSLFLIKNNSVYVSDDRSRYLDAICHKDWLPFVQWEEYAPKFAESQDAIAP